VWQTLKESQKFDWKNMAQKHDPYEVKKFGQELNVINKVTSRDYTGFDEEPTPATHMTERVVKTTANEPLESGFDSLFDNLATYKGLPAQKQQA
jgi:hypothetical protein